MTPDGRYFLARGRLWRMSNPNLSDHERSALVKTLMHARRKVGVALRANDEDTVRVARAQVDDAKRALCERGPVWWADGAPDLNRRMVRNTSYAEWFISLDPTDPE